MSDTILVTFIVQIFGIIGFFAKSWSDKRANQKETTTRDKNFQLKVLEIQSENTNINMELIEIKDMLKTHIVDNDFQLKYKNALQNRATHELYKLQNLSTQHQLILSAWNEIIEKFGIKWYYSDLRKDQKDKKANGEKIQTVKKDIQDTLTHEINLKIEFMDKIIRQNITCPKIVQASKMYFDEFINGKRENLMPIHSRTELLILALAENGLSNDGYIDLFENYLIEFYTNYKRKLDIWQSIPCPEYQDID